MAGPRIFISYSRKDGGAIAADLRHRLVGEHGFALWQDLADMEGGQDWWRQITTAIDQVEYLVLVMTPAALASPVVQREWRYARQGGTCVIPVIGAPDLDIGSLSSWMRTAHFVDPNVPEQWTRFVRTLEGPCRASRVPLMVDGPPADFVPRPQAYEALRRLLTDSARHDAGVVTVALRGFGGYGKTTLARALCHDEAVQEVFHDGILWVTLGKDPGDLGTKVEDLIVVLTGKPSHLESLEARRSRLVELLADRSLLLVIDDAWHRQHLDAFPTGNARGVRLVTTRNTETLPPGTREVAVDAMAPTEAIALLSWGLPTEQDEGAALGQLARRLGEWPILLRLVNGTLHERIYRMRDAFPNALAYVGRLLDRRGMTAFDARDPTQLEQAVGNTVGVSLELLDRQERARFQELAVLPEDVDVPFATIEAMWSRTGGLDAIDTEHLLQRLFALSLLLDLDLTTRRIRIHSCPN